MQVFVNINMLALGLSLTVPQIMQPLKNTRLVILALAANFVLVFIIVAALIGLVLLMPIGGELGKRSQAATGD